MRVIAGSARRRNLVCPSGEKTRPTTDRIKETLFNMLQTQVVDARFLDLFSGSGGIGIEALSRGSRECVFVEKGREAISCIRTNLQNTGFTEQSCLLTMDVMQALKRLDMQGAAFDIIYMDPPYEKGFEEKVIPFLLQSAIVKKGTLLILETSLAHGESQKDCYPVALERYKEYKTNCHLFYRVE